MAGDPITLVAPRGANECSDEPCSRCMGSDKYAVAYGASDSGGDTEVVDEEDNVDSAALGSHEEHVGCVVFSGAWGGIGSGGGATCGKEDGALVVI